MSIMLLLGAGGPSYAFTNSEAAAYVGAMSVQPNDTRKGVIDTFVGALKSASIWSNLELLYLLAAHDSQAARLNVVNPTGSNTLVANSSPTFTTDRGYTGNGTSSYLDTNFNPGSSSTVANANSATFGVWSRTSTLEAISVGGDTSSTSRLSLLPWTTSNLFTGRNNATATATYGTSISDATGLWVHSRTASNLVTGYHNGSSTGTSTGAPAGLATNKLAILKSGTASFSARELAAMVWGAGLDGTANTALYNALSTYMTAVGA